MIGRTIGHFRIVAKLGQGGMGVVFKAADTRLAREVALKFLPEDLARAPHAVERLRREARAASALNHPHICTIHDVAEHEGQPFIVMELLEGETLGQRLAAGGAFAAAQVAELGAQIADALEAAHASGIVHRDIKTANVFLTRRGQAKVMDFGLAKPAAGGQAMRAAEPESHATSERPTVTAAPEDSLTTPGMAVGTVAYMSPEQARGEALDARTDVFSLGAVLYEMATGRVAFPGATSAVVFDAILNRAPRPPRELNPRVPPALERIIAKALEKDRTLRHQSAAALRADLERFRAEREPGLSATEEAAARAVRSRPRYGRRRAALWAALAVVLVAAVALLATRARTRPEASHATPPGDWRQSQLTGNPPENRVLSATVSPDGKMVAFAALKGFFLEVLSSREVHALDLPKELQDRAVDIAWFPDGSRLLLELSEADDPKGERRSSLWSVPLLGTSPRKLRDDASIGEVSPDGSKVAFWHGVTATVADLGVMDADGGAARTVAAGIDTRGGHGLDWSPDGRRLVYSRPVMSPRGVALDTVSSEGGPAAELLNVAGAQKVSLAWAGDGRLFYSLPGPVGEGASLWEVGVDIAAGRPLGPPRRIAQETAFTDMRRVSVSADARRMTVVKFRPEADVYVADVLRDGRQLAAVRRLTLDERWDYPVSWSPDGRAVLFTSNRSGDNDVYRQGLDQDGAIPLISGPGDQRGPTVSPDGSWLLYATVPAEAQANPPVLRSLMRVAVSGGAPETVVGPSPETVCDCARRVGGGCVLSEREADGAVVFLALDPVKGKGARLARVEVLSRWRVSPDGRRIAFLEKADADKVVLLDLEDGSRRDLRPAGSPFLMWDLAWAWDGRGFFVTGRTARTLRVAYVDLRGGVTVLLENARVQDFGNPVASPDGRHLAFMSVKFDSNVWMLEGN